MAESHLFTPDPEDTALVKAVLGGKLQAFEQLIHKYEKLVNSIVYKMIGQFQDREDLSQDTFLKVYASLPSFRFQSRLSTWIGRIAFNLCVNYLKKKKAVLLDDSFQIAVDQDVRFTVSSSEIADTASLPDEYMLIKEKESLMLKAIADLSPIERTMLFLFHQEGLSLEEIAAVTSMNVNTIKSHLFRTRKKLKDQVNILLNA